MNKALSVKECSVPDQENQASTDDRPRDPLGELFGLFLDFQRRALDLSAKLQDLAFEINEDIDLLTALKKRIG